MGSSARKNVAEEHASEAGAGARNARLAKNLVDITLLVLLLFQMTRQFLPGAVHEATGIALGALIVAHNVQNRRWWAAPFRGSWTVRRVLLALVDVALVAVCLGCIACGLGMSGLAVSLGVAGRTMVLRSVHMALVHWAFILAGVHLGLHATQLVGRMRRSRGANAAGTQTPARDRDARAPGPQALRHGIENNADPASTPQAEPSTPETPSRHEKTAARPCRTGRVVAALVAVTLATYGARAFLKLDFPGYLTGQVRFAFIDPTQSVALFVLDHLAVFLLFALVGWTLNQLAGHYRPTRPSHRHQ